MCGILAQVARVGHIESDSSTEFELALARLHHRGPDHSEIWISPNKAARLGHCRLSINDLSPKGNQPMPNEDGSIRMVCNGEIYNYADLRARLEGLGHTFYSESDNEAVIHAYEQWGHRCLEEIQGMFAFALWDQGRQLLLAARDHLGIKPLYYHESPHRLTLASETGPLLTLAPGLGEPDPNALAYVLTLGYVPSPLAIWKGVRKLEAGQYLIYRSGKQASIKRYWSPPGQIDGRAAPTVEDLQHRFEPVLHEHLRSDLPVTLFLSGGLDSSCLAVGLRKSEKRFKAMTLGFDGFTDSEDRAAAATAAFLGMDHETIMLDVEDANELLDRTVAFFDEPQGYSAPLPLYLLSEAAAEDYKVALAGDGGDELFCGYTWYRQLDETVDRKNRWKYKALRPLIRWCASPGLRGKAMRAFASSSVLHRHAWRLFPRFLPEEAAFLFAPLGLEFDDGKMLAPLEKHYLPGLPPRRSLQRVDLMTFCTDSILAKVDRASMAHSLEVRVPWLDRRIVDWALSNPVDPREEAIGKPLLRDYLQTEAPPELLSRPKQGFSMKALRQYDFEEAIEDIEQGPWVKQGMWHPKWKCLLEPGIPFRDARIWVLKILTAWLKAWSDRPSG